MGGGGGGGGGLKGMLALPLKLLGVACPHPFFLRLCLLHLEMSHTDRIRLLDKAQNKYFKTQ